MNNYYFTWGCGHHPFDNCYTVIPAADQATATNMMTDVFGARWAFSYDHEQWWHGENGANTAQAYNMTEIKIPWERMKKEIGRKK